jgi:hypothetical protein
MITKAMITKAMIVLAVFVSLSFLFACCIEVRNERRFPWVAVGSFAALGAIFWIVAVLIGA